VIANTPWHRLSPDSIHQNRKELIAQAIVERATTHRIDPQHREPMILDHFIPAISAGTAKYHQTGECIHSDASERMQAHVPLHHRNDFHACPHASAQGGIRINWHRGRPEWLLREDKPDFSGKHGGSCLKSQVVTNCDGLVVSVGVRVPGAKHDFKLFRDNLSSRPSSSGGFRGNAGSVYAEGMFSWYANFSICTNLDIDSKQTDVGELHLQTPRTSTYDGMTIQLNTLSRNRWFQVTCIVTLI
jgi:hypothetical protein